MRSHYRIRWAPLVCIIAPTFLIAMIAFRYYARPAVVGFLGDLYNFVAAVWLAYDLLFKEHEAQRKELLEQLRVETGDRFPMILDEAVVRDRWDIERAFLRRTAREALSACLLLGLGLLLVLSARVLEFFEQARIEELWKHLTATS